MADWSDFQVAQGALGNPFTSGADLSAIAQAQPTLWAGVAAHPNAFPELLSWLGQYGDPAVQAALASRVVTPQSGLSYSQPSVGMNSGPYAQQEFAPASGNPHGFDQSQPLGYSDPTSGYTDPAAGYADSTSGYAQAAGYPTYPEYSAPTPTYGQGAPQEAYAPVLTKKSKKSKLPWILAGVGVLVVALIIVFAIVSSSGGGGILGADVPKTPTQLEQAVEERDPINCTFDVSGHKATVQTDNGWGKVKIGAREYGQDVNVLSLEDDGIYTWYSGILKMGFKMPYYPNIVDQLLDEYVTPNLFNGTLSQDDFSCKTPVGDSAFELPADIDFW